MDENTDPISSELDKMLQDFKESEFQPKGTDVGQKAVEAITNLPFRNFCNTKIVVEDGTRFKYVSEIKRVHKEGNNVKGEYCLTKYTVPQEGKKILGFIPKREKSKMVWSISSGSYNHYHIMGSDGELFRNKEILTDGGMFTGRGALILSAVWKKVKLSRSMLDEFFLPIEQRIKYIYEQNKE